MAKYTIAYKYFKNDEVIFGFLNKNDKDMYYIDSTISDKIIFNDEKSAHLLIDSFLDGSKKLEETDNYPYTDRVLRVYTIESNTKLNINRIINTAKATSKTKATSIRMPEESYIALENIIKREGINSMSSLLNTLIVDFIEGYIEENGEDFNSIDKV